MRVTIMTSLFAAPLVQLAAGELSSGVIAAPGDLRVLAGCVWLTIEGDAQDYWLHAGESLPIPPGCLVVAEAHRMPCLLGVTQRACRTPAAHIATRTLSTY